MPSFSVLSHVSRKRQWSWWMIQLSIKRDCFVCYSQGQSQRHCWQHWQVNDNRKISVLKIRSAVTNKSAAVTQPDGESLRKQSSTSKHFHNIDMSIMSGRKGCWGSSQLVKWILCATRQDGKPDTMTADEWKHPQWHRENAEDDISSSETDK